MHPYIHAQKTPNKPAVIMAASGETLTYRQLDERSNQVAGLLRGQGVQAGDHVAIFMENTPAFFEICWGAQRSGLYYTAISSRLTAQELAYILGDCQAKVLFTSPAMAAIIKKLPRDTLPNLATIYICAGDSAHGTSYEKALATVPVTPIPDESQGAPMLYSSGTTGRPKGVKRAMTAGAPIDGEDRVHTLSSLLYGFNEDMVYLTPAPLYHAAPLHFTMAAHRAGATTVVMEKFDAAQALHCIEKYKITTSQWVPTMFVRMLKLPETVRNQYDLSSHICAIHAAAPCPVLVKKQMIAWWGTIINEYYAGTEGNGFCVINSEEWLAHQGSVGRAVSGVVHICDEEGRELPVGKEGLVYFESEEAFSYHNDKEKTRKSHLDNGWSTLGDVGRVDEEGYLYLTDRKAFMIISGGVNIYPQETENVLIMHPKVTDVAVIGVPNEDFGEEVKAVVQLTHEEDATADTAQELMDFCHEKLSSLKCPRSIDFEKELPRHPTGKLYKRLLRDRYWGKKDSRIV